MAFVKGNLNAQEYQDILEKKFVASCWQIFSISFCQRTSSSRMTMNVPVHWAQSTVNYKLRNKIKSLAWPAQSPDINIIENMWLQLKNSLQRNIDVIISIDKLKAAVTTAWMKV